MSGVALQFPLPVNHHVSATAATDSDQPTKPHHSHSHHHPSFISTAIAITTIIVIDVGKENYVANLMPGNGNAPVAAHSTCDLSEDDGQKIWALRIWASSEALMPHMSRSKAQLHLEACREVRLVLIR